LTAALAAAPLGAVRVQVLQDGTTGAYAEALKGLAAAGATLETLPEGSALNERPPEGTVRLALGPKSALKLAGAPGPKAAALLHGWDVPPELAAVTLEPVPAELCGWLASAFPGRRRLLVLRGADAQPPARKVAVGALLAAARAAGLEVDAPEVASAGEAVPRLEASLQSERGEAIVFLAPDPAAVTADTLPPLLETAAGLRVPSVVSSPYFLKSGALAAVEPDAAASAVAAVQLAVSGAHAVQPAPARLVVDGRLAERLGVPVAAGPHVEVRR